MLESALIESTGPIRTARRYTTIASIGVQAAITVFLLGYPMLYPEALPHSAMSLAMLMPPVMPAPKAPPVQQATQATVTPQTPDLLAVPTNDHHIIDMTPDPTPPAQLASGPDMPSNNNVIGVMLENNSAPPIVTVAPTPTSKPERVRISSAVTAGLLLEPIRPVYPAIAKAAGVHGSVVVQAIISKTGSIESLQVVSGPDLLRNAAIAAIQAARYQPYKLNGQPIEVQTTITINFVMGS